MRGMGITPKAVLLLGAVYARHGYHTESGALLTELTIGLNMPLSNVRPPLIGKEATAELKKAKEVSRIYM